MYTGNQSTLNYSTDEHRDARLKYRRWALIPVLFCYVFGGGMTMYVIPEYIRSTIKRSYQVKESVSSSSYQEYSNHSSINDKSVSNSSYQEYSNHSSINDKVQQECARWSMYLSLATLIPAIFTNLVLGSYSDLIGRKKVLVICLSGTLINKTMTMVTIKMELALYVFIFGHLIEGLTGASTTLITLSFTYMSDLTKVGNQRTFIIVLMELLFALSYTVSSITAGYLIHATGYFYPSVAGMCVSIVVVTIAAVALPETLIRNPHSTRNNEHETNVSCSKLLHTLRNIWTLYFGRNLRITTIKYILLLLAFMFACIPQFGGVDTLYQLGSPFNWSSTRIGWYAALRVGLSSTVGLLGAYLLKKVMPNECVAAIGITSMILGFVVEAFVKTTNLMYLVPVIRVLHSLPVPMIRSLMSNMTGSDLQGALFASIGAVETICILVGNLSTNIVYSATLKIMNGFVFLVSALFALIAFVLIVAFMIVKRCTPDEERTLLLPVNDVSNDVSID